MMRRVGALDCLHDVTIYLYYALCFMLVEHSVCNEAISVLINVYIHIYIYILFTETIFTTKTNLISHSFKRSVFFRILFLWLGTKI